MSTLDLTIIGAGIGGLTVALALQRYGHRATVCEQATSLAEVGAGVMMTPNATRVLETLGLAEPLAARSVTPEYTAVRDYETGAELSRTPIGAAAKLRHGAPSYYIHRSDLHALLVEAARANDPDCVRLGRSFVALEQDRGGVVAHFTNGEDLRADALIGCDGIKSRVRQLLAPDAPTRFTGNVAWRGLVPADRLRPELRAVESIVWVGPKRHLVCYGVRGGALKNFVALAEQEAWQDEGWTVPAELADLIDDFEGWHPDALDVIRAAPPQSCFKWGLFDRDPLPSWTQGRVTLMGDAAHPMLPFVAQGAAMAIEDAASLAMALRGAADVNEAFLAYEQRRLPRTTWVQAWARANQKLYHDGVTGSQFDEDREVRARMLYDYDAFAEPQASAAA